MKTTIIPAALFYLASSSAFQMNGSTYQRTKGLVQFNFSADRLIALQMKPSTENDATILSSERRRMSLSAATLGSIDSADNSITLPPLRLPNSEEFSAVTKVSSASLLVIGNTVGSSMFVLPDTVRSVGMAWGSVIFVGVYLYNLISGLSLADVAINLHETSDCEVPSSFKDFADCAMKDKTAGNAIGAASLLMNSCFLSYGMVQVGSFVSQTLLPGLNLDPTSMVAAYSILLGVAFCTQKNDGIENIANAAVMVLFSSFAALLLPSLVNVQSPMDTFVVEGTHPEQLASAISAAIPLIVSTMIYQNIVPSVVKMLEFDRTKSTIAIALGSFVPMIMYMAWCFAVLGGGLDNSLASGAGGAMFAAFTASSFLGSSIGCVMSLAEEYESIITSTSQEEDASCKLDGGFSVPAVVMSVLPPAAVALTVSNGGDGAFTAPLHLSGAVIAPFLYGLLPIMLLQSIRSETKGQNAAINRIPQVLLGASTVGLLGNEIIHDCSNWFS